MPTATIHHGDMLDVLKLMPKESVDAVVTDPPYGLSFMSKEWDHEVPDARYWRRCWHRLKPGGYLVAFSSSRTYHRLASAIEDAGFEIRDQLMWLYGQGMPKGSNLGRRVEGWDDWSTALKPAHEPIVLARKPISEKTVAENVRRWGTGALNIGGCRVTWGAEQPTQEEWNRLGSSGAAGSKSGHLSQNSQSQKDAYAAGKIKVPPGRWPANVLHDGSPEVLENFPEAPGQQGDLLNHAEDRQSKNGIYGRFAAARDSIKRDEVEKSAARFFYCAKATKADRAGSTHPTVKPVAVMRWLVRLVTPPGGVVLEPFAGSGTTGEAALAEGHDCIMVEREADHASQLAVRFAGRTAPVPEIA